MVLCVLETSKVTSSLGDSWLGAGGWLLRRVAGGSFTRTHEFSISNSFVYHKAIIRTVKVKVKTTFTSTFIALMISSSNWRKTVFLSGLTLTSHSSNDSANQSASYSKCFISRNILAWRSCNVCDYDWILKMIKVLVYFIKRPSNLEVSKLEKANNMTLRAIHYTTHLWYFTGPRIEKKKLLVTCWTPGLRFWYIPRDWNRCFAIIV